MYSISDELRQRFEQGERKTARVTFGNYAVDKTITEADIVSNGLSIDRYCVTGNKIEIGSAVAAELSLVLDNSSGKFDGIVFEGAQLFVEIGIAGDEGSYIPCGKFTVDEPPRNNTRISLKALDYMMLFDNKADVSKLNFSNAKALVESVCSECEVDLSSNVDFAKFANTNIELSEPTTEVTYRQLLQWACEIIGVCAYMDGVGELMLAWYSDDINATFDPSVRYSGTMHEADIKISGVTIKKGDSDITKGTANDVVLIIENNQLIDGNLEKIKAIAEGVLTKTGGFTYRPFECSCLPMPYLYPLDKVAYTYKDKDGKDVSFYSVITNHTFGLNTTSSFAAKGETAQQKNYSKSKGVTKAEIDAAVAEALAGVDLGGDHFYVMYSAYPNGRVDGKTDGDISMSEEIEADTQYFGTCVTPDKSPPPSPESYNWLKVGGKDGPPGQDGISIMSVNEYYTASSSPDAPFLQTIIGGKGIVEVTEVSKTSGVKETTRGEDDFYTVNMNYVDKSYILLKLTFNVYETTDITLQCINYGEFMSTSNGQKNIDYMLVSKISTDENEHKFCESWYSNETLRSQDEAKAKKVFRTSADNSLNVVDVVFPNVSKGTHYVYVKVQKDASDTWSSERFKFKCGEISGEWENSIPSKYGEDYPYLWNYTETVFSEGDPSTTEPQVIAHWGKVGSDGKGISAIEEYYCITQTEDVPDIDDFGNANEVKYPTIYYPFLWNYEIVRYTDGSATENPTIKLVGVYGQNGDDGAGIASVTNWYYTCNEAEGITNDSDVGWEQTITPVSKDKKYLWNYEEIAYTDGRQNSKTPACIIGNFAEDGKDGDGITDVIEYYATSTQPGDAPDNDDYSTTVPALDATNKYLWNKELIKTTSDPDGSFTTACVIGVYGEDGKTYYTWIKYADDADGTNISDNPAGKAYMGIAINKPVPEESAADDDVNDASTYKWSRIIGDSAIAYSMVLSTHVIRKDNENNLAPSSITLTAKSQVGTSTPEKCYCYFKVEKSTDATLASWGTEERLGRYQETSFSSYDSTIKGLRFSMYLDSGYTNLLDQQTVPVISDGTDGDGKNGEDAYTVILSNENHTFAGVDGKATSTTLNCYVSVYKGATKLNTKITKINTTAVSGNSAVTLTGFKVTPRNNTTYSASNYVEIQASPSSTNLLTSASGSIAFEIEAYDSETKTSQKFKKDFSYSVVCDGKDGQSITVYSILPSVDAIVKDKDGNYNPANLTVSAKQQTGNGALSTYSGRFLIETTTDMSTWTSTSPNGYTSSTNESSKTFAIPNGIKAIRCSLHLAGNSVATSTLLDQQVVPVVSDGTNGIGKDAYTVILSNENHTFVGDDTKVLGTQTTTCDVIAYKGATQQAVTLGTATLPAGATGITVTPSGNGTTNAKLTVSVDSTLSPLSGSISIPITIDSNKSFTKTFSYSVALKGNKGDPGKGISSITEYYLASADASASPASELVTPVNFSMAVQEVSKTSGVTGCALGGDGYYSVDMNKANSSYFLARLTFNVTRPTDVVLKCINYAEYDWDYMMVSKISTNANEYKFGEGNSVTTTEKGYAEVDFEILHSENPVDIVYENVAVGTHYVYVKVYKDSSNTKDKETFKFKAMEPASWSTTVPTDYGTDKPYLWNYTRTDYSDGTFQESSPAVISCYGGQGEDGKGISSIEEYYCTTASNSPPATTSFTKHTPGTATPKPDATKQYLWNYEKIIYTKGNPTVTDVRLVCVFGKNGDNGRGVNSIKTQYYLSTSNSTQINGSWLDAMPAWQAGRYLWKREVVYYTDAPSTPVDGTPILETSWDKLGTIDSVVNAAEASLSETLLLGNGLKKTTLADGSIYYHTNSVLQNSVSGDIICVLNSNGFGVCKSGWNNGNLSFSYGSTFAGAALWDTVTARKISADMIEAGTIEALPTAKLHSSWSLDKGTMDFVTPDSQKVASIHAELTTVYVGADGTQTQIPLGNVGFTIQNLTDNLITQIADGQIRIYSRLGLLDRIYWLQKELFKVALNPSSYTIDWESQPNSHETIITKDDIQTKVIRCEDVELYKFSDKPNKTVKLYDAVNSIAAMVSSTKLYPVNATDGPSNGTITLKYSVSSYDFIEIYFQDSNDELGGCTKLYKPNGKTALLSINQPVGGTTYIRSTRVAIDGTTITPDTSDSNCIAITTGNLVSKVGTNQIYITRVMGGKYIS